MPIYAYKCASCGLSKDVLQKLSDAPLEVCPACGKPTLQKQVTAAGFQLKGSGWYVTDFKDGNKKPAADKKDADGGDGKSASDADPSRPADGAAPAGSDPAPASETRSGDKPDAAATKAPADSAAAPAVAKPSAAPTTKPVPPSSGG